MRKISAFLFSVLVCTACFTQNSIITFDLNYDTAECIEPLIVSTGRAAPLDAKPFPVREGFRFGGWYTSRECLPEQEWRFGTNSSFYVNATDSMKVDQSITLYAKWVSPKHISTPQELSDIRNDLYGWYVLENDIDLSEIENWIPIGEYEADYEFAPGEWWRHAFKGILDGQGHSIRGLKITELKTDKSGLFATVANGVIRNLNMQDSRLEFSAPRPYVAPLAGILKQDDNRECLVENCNVSGTLIKVRTTNSEPTFHSFCGLCGGAWGGTIRFCSVSGKMDLEIAGDGGGELYVSPCLGEAYNNTANCSADYDIRVKFSSAANEAFSVFVGGLQASGTNISNCDANGSISLEGKPGSENIFVGGIVGSERYGAVSSCSSEVRIKVSNMDGVQVGGIVGEFNEGYGTMGAAFGISTTKVENCSYRGTPRFRRVPKAVFGKTAGAGTPAPLVSPWGMSMNYEITGCSYTR